MSAHRLRRIVAALRAGTPIDPNDANWFTVAVERYFEGARRGLRLDRVLGLVPEPGQPAWWTIEDRHERDSELRAHREKFCSDTVAIMSAAG